MFFGCLLAPLIFELLPKVIQVLLILRADPSQAFLCLLLALRLYLDVAQRDIVVQTRVCLTSGGIHELLYAILARVDASHLVVLVRIDRDELFIID